MAVNVAAPEVVQVPRSFEELSVLHKGAITSKLNAYCNGNLWKRLETEWNNPGEKTIIKAANDPREDSLIKVIHLEAKRGLMGQGVRLVTGLAPIDVLIFKHDSERVVLEAGWNFENKSLEIEGASSYLAEHHLKKQTMTVDQTREFLTQWLG